MLLLDADVKFVFDEAALVITSGGRSYIVIGDLHIGIERKLREKGVNLHNASDAMLKKINSLSERFDCKNIIMLGDVKDAILNPDAIDADSIRHFFAALDGYDVTVVLGNHDAHLGEIIGVKTVDELLLDRFALLHGNRWPTQEAMMADYIITAHNHVAIRITDKNGGAYTEKAWLVAPLDKDVAGKYYEKFNSGIKLVVAPAFNDLIIGKPINEIDGKMLNPLLNNKVFDYENGDVYTIKADALGKLNRYMKRV